MVLAFLWGGYVLWRQYNNLSKIPGAENR